MADDEVPPGGSESTGGQGDQPTTREVASGEREDPTPREQKTDPPADKPPEVRRTEPVSESDALIERLNKMISDMGTNEANMYAKLKGDIDALEKQGNVQQPSLTQGTVSAPPPPTEQQRGGLAEFVGGLLKWSALGLIMFGGGGRSRGHNAIYKSAIGAALLGFSQGRKDVSDRALKVWEKNREIVNDANREQNANNRAILADNRLALNQKMDLIKAHSDFYRDYVNADNARRQDLLAIQKIQADKEKAQKDKEEWERKNRHRVYDIIGHKAIDLQYYDWIRAKTGVQITHDTSQEQFDEFMKQHPELQFSEFFAEKTKRDEEEKAQQSKTKAYEDEKARLKAKKEADEGNADQSEAAKKDAKVLEGLIR